MDLANTFILRIIIMHHAQSLHYKAKLCYPSWYLFVQTAVLNIIVLNFFVSIL